MRALVESRRGLEKTREGRTLWTRAILISAFAAAMQADELIWQVIGHQHLDALPCCHLMRQKLPASLLPHTIHQPP